MKNYKAFYIIMAFTEKELDSFEDFLKSPYFNTRKKPLELFRLIKKLRTKPESEISKQKIFGKLYPGKEFNSNTFNDLMAQLYKFAETFLYAEINETDKIKKDVTLLQKFLDGRFKNLFEYKKKRLEKLIKNNREADPVYYWNCFLKDAISMGYIQMYRRLKSKKDFNSVSENLYNAVTNITNLYVEEIVAAFIQSQTRGTSLDFSGFPIFIKKIISKLYDNNFLNLFIENDRNNYTLILLEKLLALSLSEDDKNIYLDFKKNLFKYRKNLTHEQFSHYFGSLRNYCFKNIRSEKKTIFFTNEFFSLFELTISSKYYSNTMVRFFRPKLYANFLSVFLTEKKTVLINKLIKSAIPLLEKKHSEYYLNLSLAYLDYLNGNYQSALEKIRDLKTFFKDNEMRLKIFTIQLHYMLGNTEQVLSSVSSFKKYLKTAYYAQEIKYIEKLNFANAAEKLILKKSKGDRDGMTYLRKKITEKIYLAEKVWLIERLDEIVNKNKAKN